MLPSPSLHSITPAQTCYTFTWLTEVVNPTQWKAILDEWLSESETMSQIRLESKKSALPLQSLKTLKKFCYNQ